jgi:hypothetical protein
MACNHVVCTHTACNHVVCTHTACNHVVCTHTACSHVVCTHTACTHTAYNAYRHVATPHALIFHPPTHTHTHPLFRLFSCPSPATHLGKPRCDDKKLASLDSFVVFLKGLKVLDGGTGVRGVGGACGEVVRVGRWYLAPITTLSSSLHPLILTSPIRTPSRTGTPMRSQQKMRLVWAFSSPRQLQRQLARRSNRALAGV